MNGDNANAEELDGLSGAQLFSNANGCSPLRIKHPHLPSRRTFPCAHTRLSPVVTAPQTRTKTTSSSRATLTSELSRSTRARRRAAILGAARPARDPRALPSSAPHRARPDAPAHSPADPPPPSPPLPFLKDFGLAQTKLRAKAAREQERERETGTAINEPSGYRWHTRERSRAPRWVSGSRTKPPEVAAVHEGPLLLGSLYDTCSLHEDGVETVSQTRPGVAAAGTLATTALTPVTTPGFCSPDFSKLE